MEEILASIRRIIADEPSKFSRNEPPSRGPTLYREPLLQNEGKRVQRSSSNRSALKPCATSRRPMKCLLLLGGRVKPALPMRPFRPGAHTFQHRWRCQHRQGPMTRSRRCWPSFIRNPMPRRPMSTKSPEDILELPERVGAAETWAETEFGADEPAELETQTADAHPVTEPGRFAEPYGEEPERAAERTRVRQLGRAVAQDGAQEALVSAATSAAVDSAFNALAQTVLVQNGRTLEDLVRELLRPMLKAWLDDNLPNMVERLVRAEIERVSRGR